MYYIDPPYADSVGHYVSIADKRMVKVVGEPYRGKPDVRFDEGRLETGRVREPAACDS